MIKTTATTKPLCNLIGTDGNIFALLGTARRCLRDAGQGDKASEMVARATASHSYAEALAVIQEYVEVR